MKTIIGLLLISLCLFTVDSGSACDDAEWEDNTHDHRPMADGHGGGEHTHADWLKKCPDGTTLVNPSYTDAHSWGEAIRDTIEDFPQVQLRGPDDPPPSKNTPQPPAITEVEEIFIPRVDEEPRLEAQIDETRTVPDNTIPPGLLAQPDGTPQNPTQNPTQNPAQTTDQPQTSQPQTGVIPQPTQPQVTQQPLRTTEYMVRDWSRSSGGGLPQWIELYNPNPNPILLHNCVFSYVAIVNFNKKVKQVRVDNFTVPAESAVIFVTHAVRPNRFGGVTAEQVYDLKIKNVLKRGWSLTTANGGVISKAGEAFGGSRPVAPKHVEGERQSYTRYTETDTETAHFYGSASDIGTPGYHVPLAPAAPRLLRKQIGLWGSLKTEPFLK